MSSKKLINNELKFTLTFKTQLLTIEYLGGLMKTTQIRFLFIIVIIGFIMSVIVPSPVMADPVWELQYCTQTGMIPQMLRVSGGVLYGVSNRYFIISPDGVNYHEYVVANCDSLQLGSAFMLTPSVGYCCGCFVLSDIYNSPRSVLYKTVNGGQSWTRTYQLERNKCLLKHIQFVSPQEGYALMGFDFFGIRIYKTINGGQDWSIVFESERSSVICADFQPNLKAVGRILSPFIITSPDGQTWQETVAITNPPSYIIVSANRIITTVVQSVFYSDNQGASWSLADISQLGADFSPTMCLTTCGLSGISGNLYMIGGIWDGNNEHPGIVRSLNNGVSWQWLVLPTEMPDQSGQIYGICYWGEYIYISFNACIYRLHVGPPVANDDDVASVVPVEVSCYPNPFQDNTTLTLKQEADHSPTTVAVYNMRGQLVRRLLDSQPILDEYSITWDGKNDQGQRLGSGIYFFKVKSGSYSTTRKTILIK